jgi:hypothetical protein
MGKLFASFNGVTFSCSAMMLAPTVVLTAVHCIYNCPTLQAAETVSFYDRYYDGDFVAWAPVSSMAYFRSFCLAGSSIDPYDFAVVRLSFPLASRQFPTTVRSTQRAVLNSLSGILLHYPAGPYGGRLPYLSTRNPMSWEFINTGGILEADVSGQRGSSGSPLFVLGLPGNQYRTSPAIVAVTSYEYRSGLCPNGFAAFQPGWNPDILRAALP